MIETIISADYRGDGKGLRPSGVSYWLTCVECSLRIGDQTYILPQELVVDQSGMSVESRDEVVLTVSHREPAKTVRLTLKRESPTAVMGAKAVSVGLKWSHPSGVIGTEIPLYVYLLDGKGNLVAPQQGTTVYLNVRGGTADPPDAKLTPGTPWVISRVKLLAAQEVSINAASPGLNGSKESATVCGTHPVGDLRASMGLAATGALADGKHRISIPVTVEDSKHTPATDDLPKDIGFSVEGVAEWVEGNDGSSDAGTVPAGQCEIRQHLIAHRSGTGAANISLGGIHREPVAFWAELTILAICLALLGGIAGGFVSAERNNLNSSKWQRRRWLYWLASASVCGLALYLTYFYGLLRRVPAFSDGAGISLWTPDLYGAFGRS